MKQSGLYIGTLSGTSMDGIDVVISHIPEDGTEQKPEMVHAQTCEFNFRLRESLQNVLKNSPKTSMHEVALLDQMLGHAFADAILKTLKSAALEPADITATGCHGQTIAHQITDTHAYTIQCCDANIVAERTGITTVSDFRRRDMAAGGEGAPLAPAFHNVMFSTDQEHRSVVNIGGIANITCLPRIERSIELTRLSRSTERIRGYDCGPGNCLLDDWIDDQKGLAYDKNGEWSAGGDVSQALLSRMMSDPFVMKQAPKSIGREYFSLEWLTSQLAERVYQPRDIQATLAQFTAESIADAINHSQPDTQRVLICGGGAHNSDLINRLRQLLPQAVIESSERSGVNPDWVEGMLFGWLAHQRMNNAQGNCPSVTGASGDRILGAIHAG